MALPPTPDRMERACRHARRRTLRARILAAIAVVAVAHWTHAACARTSQDDARPGSDSRGSGASAMAHAHAPAPEGGDRGGAGRSPAQEARELPVAAPARTGTRESGWGEAVRTGAALAVVVGLVGAAWWWLRRTGVGTRGAGGAFEVVARHPIGRGQQIVVARFGSRVLCLQQTREGLRTLCEVSNADEARRILAEIGVRGSGQALLHSEGWTEPPAEPKTELRNEVRFEARSAVRTEARGEARADARPEPRADASIRTVDLRAGFRA